MLSADQREFLVRTRAYIPAAEAGGVPGPVMIAQAAIESGWGRSGLARLGNGYFGIKARPNGTGKVYSGTTREWIPGRGYLTVAGRNRVYPSHAEAVADGCRLGSLFRAYDTFEDNVRDYVQFFHENPRYHSAIDAYVRTRDPRQCASLIARAGYATSPTYERVLLVFMEVYLADLLPARWRIQVNGVSIAGESVRVVGGRVFVHVRPLAAALGMRVKYEGHAKTVWVEEGRR